MTSEDVQQNVEASDSVESTEVSGDNFDYKSAYNKEVANAKKQRQSRQKMEANWKHLNKKNLTEKENV